MPGWVENAVFSGECVVILTMTDSFRRKVCASMDKIDREWEWILADLQGGTRC